MISTRYGLGKTRFLIMPPPFDPEEFSHINHIIEVACQDIGISVATREAGPTDTLLEALGFAAGEPTLRLLAAVDADSLSTRDVDRLDGAIQG